MKWRKYTIYTTVAAEDMVSLMLGELGVEGVQIEDNVPLSDTDTKGMFIDILPELPPDDGTSRLSFYLRLPDGGTGNDGNTDGGVFCGTVDTAEFNAVRNDDSYGNNAAGGGDYAGMANANAALGAADNSYTINDRIWSEEEIIGLLASMRSGLEDMKSYIDIGEGRIEEDVTEDTDWRDNWKQFFKPIRVGGFLIKPSWETGTGSDADGSFANDPDLRIINIDPGTAFGTGSHETTQLCIEAEERYISGGENVLDIGTGSGILGLAALKLGALSVTATELDEMCEASIRENMDANSITDGAFRLIIGNIIGDDTVISAVHGASPDGYDVITANILAPVIAALAGKGIADSFCKKGGVFITSGIIDTKLSDVKAAFAANPAWEIIEVNIKGEWCSVVAEKVTEQEIN